MGKFIPSMFFFLLLKLKITKTFSHSLFVFKKNLTKYTHFVVNFSQKLHNRNKFLLHYFIFEFTVIVFLNIEI